MGLYDDRCRPRSAVSSRPDGDVYDARVRAGLTAGALVLRRWCQTVVTARDPDLQ